MEVKSSELLAVSKEKIQRSKVLNGEKRKIGTLHPDRKHLTKPVKQSEPRYSNKSKYFFK